MPTTPKSPPSASSSEPPKPSRTYHRPKRKPGAQPGNLNALTNGFYSHALSAAQALELHDAQALPTDDLSDEIAILRPPLLPLTAPAPHPPPHRPPPPRPRPDRPRRRHRRRRRRRRGTGGSLRGQAPH